MEPLEPGVVAPGVPPHFVAAFDREVPQGTIAESDRKWLFNALLRMLWRSTWNGGDEPMDMEAWIRGEFPKLIIEVGVPALAARLDTLEREVALMKKRSISPDEAPELLGLSPHGKTIE